MSNTTTAHVGKHDHTILVVHGPNLNMLGTREPDVYGTQTLDDINRMLAKVAERREVNLVTYQSNIEGDIITVIQQYASKSDGLIINPAGYTNGYPALYAAISQVNFPVFELHISNPARRGRVSDVAGSCQGVLTGFGILGYSLALRGLLAATLE